MKKAKIQVVSLPLPNGTVAAKRAFQVDLDPEFKTCRGFYVIRNSGADYLKIEVLDTTGKSILDAVNIQHLVVGTDIKIKDRFFTETPFKAQGGKTTINLQNFAAAAGDQVTDIIFLLDNEEI